jgi:hypothetical protein
MESKYREFCPKHPYCEDKCELCIETKGDLGHEINKNYLKSINKICLCAECCDTDDDSD